MSNASLRRLAEAAGISIEWTDAFNHPKTVSDDTLRAVLAALGLPAENDAACAQSLASLAGGADGWPLPPLVTARVDAPIVFDDHAALRGQDYAIELEGGGRIDGRLGDEAPLQLAVIAAPGYHRMRIAGHALTLAVAPPRCYSVQDAAAALNRADAHAPRLWGIATQLYSLPRPGDAGIGDFGALADFVKQAGLRGASAVAISPVHAMFSDDLQRFSPYGPSTRVLFNVLHIDLDAVLGVDALRAVLAEDGLGEEAARLEGNAMIDWPASSNWKLKVLRRLYQRFIDAGGSAEFDAFRHDGGDSVEDHARFETMHAWRRAQGENGDWRSWPEEYRDSRGPAIAAFANAHADEVRFHAFLQWQAARGLQHAQDCARAAGMAIGIISDLAVGADPAGSQAWSRQDQMIHGLSVGAPPDVLGPMGQNWGLGAFSPVALKRHGYGAYIEMLRSAFRHAGGVRIDHVLGLTRLWLVPDGFPATEGAYLRFPFDDLVRLIALESWRHRAVVIGEDLGTIPQGFPERLAAERMLGIRVMFFQRDWHGYIAPQHWSPDAMATTTTHDLPTVAGWWAGRDIGWRAQLNMLGEHGNEERERGERDRDRHALWQAMRAAGCLGWREHEGPPPPEHAPVDEAIAFVGKTAAPLAMIPVEDLLALPEAPNLPGTIDQHPNWRRRMPQAAASIFDAAEVANRIHLLNAAREGKPA
ncbi:4-alpha-glucanotransferase [Noviherbaspirillum pedocola]|uniref:4-alpha-glucanotransferase n=1 Tax=Noviherbaspirillum pedocola TaxID=2801341 RepID=A0A934W480_9BURK|nr:4-alpha-glucanotransferase [Noviherbaspirillum pedocola]MBK4738236.1 4-alpha-glucanotransferase [Noviherbaspirillum pedocola]